MQTKQYLGFMKWRKLRCQRFSFSKHSAYRREGSEMRVSSRKEAVWPYMSFISLLVELRNRELGPK